MAWRTVPFTKTSSRNREDHHLHSSTTGGPTNTAVLQSANPNNLAKKLRAASVSLSGLPNTTTSSFRFVSQVVLPFVKANVGELLHQILTKGGEGAAARVESVTVRVVGLGIGAFHPAESKASFLQMAAFLSIVKACQRLCSSENVRVEASCFDPCMKAFHKKCCDCLQVAVDGNQRGAYAAVDQHSGHPQLMVIYAPHAPWSLLHNIFVANWPSLSNSEESDPVHALRHLLVIANDPREAPLLRSHETLCVLHSDFPSLFTLTSMADQSSVQKPRRREAEDMDDEANEGQAAHIGNGMSCNEASAAFDGTACYRVRRDLTDAEVLQKLSSISPKPPTHIKHASEMR